MSYLAVVGGLTTAGVAAALYLRKAKPAKVGDKIPSIELHYGFPPEKIDVLSRIAGKKVLIVGLPGAFTPT